jgi:hypothetical protein
MIVLIKMDNTSEVSKYISNNYIILSKEEAKVILAKLKQADLLLKLVTQKKSFNLWT